MAFNNRRTAYQQRTGRPGPELTLNQLYIELAFAKQDVKRQEVVLNARGFLDDIERLRKDRLRVKELETELAKRGPEIEAFVARMAEGRRNRNASPRDNIK